MKNSVKTKRKFTSKMRSGIQRTRQKLTGKRQKDKRHSNKRHSNKRHSSKRHSSKRHSNKRHSSKRRSKKNIAGWTRPGFVIPPPPPSPSPSPSPPPPPPAYQDVLLNFSYDEVRNLISDMENSGLNSSLKEILKRLIFHHNVIKQEDDADVKLISMKRIGYLAITEFIRIFGEDDEDSRIYQLYIQANDLLEETYLSEDRIDDFPVLGVVQYLDTLPVLKEKIDEFQEIYESTPNNVVGWNGTNLIAAWFIYFGPVSLDDDNYFEIFTDEAIGYDHTDPLHEWEDIRPSMQTFLEDNPIPLNGTYEEKYIHLHKWLGDLSDSEFVNYDYLMQVTLNGHQNAVEYYEENS